ncbi:uncharacterized protein [Ptychodera flava]|uniref:uncharacterized protein n=1 Tax=Ptychodera flava TaxID=63121 RepID=UPI003969F490
MRQELGRGTVIGQCFQKDNFVIGVFNKRGGHLQHSKLKVNLFIPPNAIPDDERREIYLYITQEDNDDDGMTLSPTVYCGPLPYRFNRHLLLTFPHYATRMEDWDVEMKIKPTNDPSNSDELRHECWKPMHGDVESKTHVEGDRCYVYINHFTGFKLTGRPLSPTPMIEMLVLVFLQSLTSVNVNVRVYILHNHDSLKEQILNDEMRTWHSRPTQGPPQILHILYASESTMTIAAKVTSRGICSVHPDKHECVAIATGVNRYVFRTFIMKPNPEENQTLDFDIELIWNGDNRLLIPISEGIGAQEPQAAALDPVQITMKACREEFSRLPINRQVIPDHAFGDLCIYLDQTMDPSPSPDYRHLAERMGIPPNIIQWIALQKGGYTSKVLSWWEEKTKREHPRESRYDSLKKLEALLQDIGHNGAVQVVRKLTRDSGISVGARSLASSLSGSNASKSKLQPYGTELVV